MTLSAGSVTYAEDGSYSGTGMAKAMADGMAAQFAGEKFNQNTGKLINALASSVVSYMTSNASVTITVKTTDSGLQRTPSPNNASTATQGPAADKTLSGTVA